MKLSRFAASLWHVRADRRAEVLVGGEGLARGPVAVLGTLAARRGEETAVVEVAEQHDHDPIRVIDGPGSFVGHNAEQA